MHELYIGLMSGTSLDGLDAALVGFEYDKPILLATHYEKISNELRQRILALSTPGTDEIYRMGQLDVLLGKAFAEVVNNLLDKNNLNPEEIAGIGSHGQTIRHYPNESYTLQIGDPNIIAAETGITTVADFRRRDLALGGQGAPLVPAFHAHMFADPLIDRAIVNIGGIANMTLLKANQPESVIGFDTGPGNILLNAWVDKHLKLPLDVDGTWARSGKLNSNLLARLMNDSFFKQAPPKSTGREYFNLAWLETQLLPTINAVDIQATLVELTVQTILQAVGNHLNQGEIYICGGGAKNLYLMERLTLNAKNFSVQSTAALGIEPDWVEAAAFAWLAKRTLTKQHGNAPLVTGAKQGAILGGVYFA